MEWHWETQKKSEKRELAKVQVVQPNGTSWHKLAQVEQVEQVEAGLQIYVEQVGQEQGGLQIDVEQVGQEQGVCPAEPLHLTQSGTTRPWRISIGEDWEIPRREFLLVVKSSDAFCRPIVQKSFVLIPYFNT